MSDYHQTSGPHYERLAKKIRKQNAKAQSELAASGGSVQAVPSLCEIRHGIGLCDDCGKPAWPQRYMGYGCMVCLDCIAAAERKALNAPGERPPTKEREPR